MNFVRASWFPLLLGLVILIVTLDQLLCSSSPAKDDIPVPPAPVTADDWQAPDLDSLANDERGALIRYGHALIANTALYLGPKGTISAGSNGMNCQNCHVDAGAKLFAGSFSAVATTYPRYRERSGRVESIEFRVNECMERSMNGTKLDSLSKEMRAMVAYLKWIGSNVPAGKKPAGSGLEELPFLDRAADPGKGKQVFIARCQSCHGENGQGLLNHDSSFYIYPPLWGPNSYNVSAGLYRLSRFASFVKNNMPFGLASHNAPQLSDEESWDVAAFVNSQPRPEKFFLYDWPKKETKPVDYPYGPFSDNFSEKQHKYGPFGPIREAKNKK